LWLRRSRSNRLRLGGCLLLILSCQLLLLRLKLLLGLQRLELVRRRLLNLWLLLLLLNLLLLRLLSLLLRRRLLFCELGLLHLLCFHPNIHCKLLQPLFESSRIVVFCKGLR
jgi:hypothetical protein